MSTDPNLSLTEKELAWIINNIPTVPPTYVYQDSEKTWHQERSAIANKLRAIVEARNLHHIHIERN